MNLGYRGDKSMNIKRIFKAKAKDDLVFINILSILLIIVVIFFPSSILRPIIGIPFVLFFPGYVLLSVLFPNNKPNNELSTIERIALSLALSIVIVSFLGLLLCFSPIGLKLYPAIFSLYLIILILSIIGWVLKFKKIQRDFLNAISIKQKQEILIFILILILLTLIRFLPTWGYSPVPTQYEGEYVFNYIYLLNHGHFPNNLPVYGVYDMNINRKGDPLILIMFPHVYLQIITNLPNPMYFAFRPVITLRPVILSICLSAILSLTTLTILQKYNKKLHLIDKVLVILFSLSGSPTILLALTGQNTGYGFVFFMVLVSIYLQEKINYKYFFLILVFSIYLMIVYHTIALMFATLLIISILYTLLFKKKVFNYIYVLFYLVTFTAYLIYIYNSFLGTTVFQFIKFILILTNKIKPYLTLKYLSFPHDLSFIVIYGISIVTGVVPLFFAFIFSFLDKYIPSNCYLTNKEKDILRITITTFLLACLGFYSYMGIAGLIHRGKEYASYFSVLAFSILLSRIRSEYLRKFMIVCVIIAISTSIYVYSTSGAHRFHLTTSESLGNKWAVENIPKREVIFTDLRLASMLVAKGHLKVVGPLDPPRVTLKQLIKRLDNIFYRNDIEEAIKSLKNITTTTGESPKYLIFSMRMTKGYPEPSIYVAESNVKPAPKNFLCKFENSSKINKIYGNGNINIYKLI